MYYFYCPNCGKEDVMEKLPKGTVINIRDGFGKPIRHYECSNCHNLDAGFMEERTGDDDEKKYYRHVIGMYQNIRGFNKIGEKMNKEFEKGIICEFIGTPFSNKEELISIIIDNCLCSHEEALRIIDKIMRDSFYSGDISYDFFCEYVSNSYKASTLAKKIMTEIHKEDKTGELLYLFCRKLCGISKLRAYDIGRDDKYKFVIITEDEYAKLKGK